MTAYVNNPKVRHIRQIAGVILAMSLGMSQMAVIPVSAAALPKPAIQTNLSVAADGSIAIGQKVKTSDATGVLKTMYMDSTAYTSTPEECDGDPFVTADGSDVADGIVATNVLPFGTKIRLPTVFGDKVFTVHDRMNARYSYRVDIWMADHNAMIQYGLKRNIPIEVLSYGDNTTQWAARAEKIKEQRTAEQHVKEIALAMPLKK
jgi:3D (Asp-Asp-Asp) domain-containing protein